jgi:hypothetical protein
MDDTGGTHPANGAHPLSSFFHRRESVTNNSSTCDNLLDYHEEIVEKSSKDYDPYAYAYEGESDNNSDLLENWDWEAEYQ